MKKTLSRAAFMTALMTAAISFSSFAATQITSVKFTADIDESETCSTGITSPDFQSDDEEQYSLSYEDTSTSSTTTATAAKNAKTYKLTFSANGDYEFPSNANSITVQGTGIESITSKKVTDDGATLEVKVKAYPYVKLETPDLTTSDFSKNTVTIDKKGAGTVEYVIVYTNYDGDTKTAHGTTTGSTIKISSYNKEYKGNKEKNPDKDDMKIEEIALRATKLNSSSNPNIVPSDWSSEPSDADYEFTSYETWGDWTDGTPKNSSSSSSSKGNVINNNTSSNGGWTGSGNNWYYKNSVGVIQKGWVQDGNNWYYCDPSNSGKMKAGWIKDSDGNWYYLNEQHDGTYGRMLTSWQNINGVTYYFRPNSGGPLGSMVCNATVSINGVLYTFNADGARVG